MDIAFAVLAGILGGLAILALVQWLPLQLAREEAEWRAEMLNQPLNSVPLPPISTRLPIKAFLAQAGLAVVLGIGVAVACVSLAGWSPRTGFNIVFLWSLAALALIDIRMQLLPDRIVLPMLWLGILLQTTPALATVGLDRAVWGAVAGYLLLFVPAKLFHMLRRVEAMGHGDFKLMSLIGAWLGPASLIWTLLVASIAAVIFYLARGAGRRTEFPFGPWLIAAAMGQIALTGAGF